MQREEHWCGRVQKEGNWDGLEGGRRACLGGRVPLKWDMWWGVKSMEEWGVCLEQVMGEGHNVTREKENKGVHRGVSIIRNLPEKNGWVAGIQSWGFMSLFQEPQNGAGTAHNSSELAKQGCKGALACENPGHWWDGDWNRPPWSQAQWGDPGGRTKIGDQTDQVTKS